MVDCSPNTYTTYQALATAEGIVRKLRRSSPTSDIAFVYITTAVLAQEYNLVRGVMPEIMQIYERLADHYGITSIHMGLDIVRKAMANEVVWRTNFTDAAAFSDGKYIFGSDGVHPRKETGCAAYARAIGRSLPRLEQGSKTFRTDPPPPLHPNNYEAAQLVAPERAAMSPSVQKITPELIVSKPYANVTGFLAQEPGAVFRLGFFGSTVGILMLVGPFSGDLVVSIDDQPPREVNIFDTYCYFPRKGFYLLYDDLDRSNHTLVVDVSPHVPAKRSILVTRQRHIDSQYLTQTEAVVMGFGFV